jgi:type IV pilus assembly protein PilV
MHRMKSKQTGSFILEALISILIFSIGILGIVGLQAAAIKDTAAAKYRTDASLLVNQIVGQMWVDDKTNAGLIANYESPGGAKYLDWKSGVVQALPGASATPPTITIGANNAVTVTVWWQSPDEFTPHNYTAIANVID